MLPPGDYHSMYIIRKEGLAGAEWCERFGRGKAANDMGRTGDGHDVIGEEEDGERRLLIGC